MQNEITRNHKMKSRENAKTASVKAEPGPVPLILSGHPKGKNQFYPELSRHVDLKSDKLLRTVEKCNVRNLA